MANAKPIKMKPGKTELQTTDGITIRLAADDGTKLELVPVQKEVAPGITVTTYVLQEKAKQ